MASSLTRFAWCLGVVLPFLIGCQQAAPRWSRQGSLLCSRIDSIVQIDLRSGAIDTLMSIGAFAGEISSVSLMGAERLVYGVTTIHGARNVVVHDLARGEQVARYEGLQAVAADDDHTVVYWRLMSPSSARLVWRDIRGDSGVIGDTKIKSAAFLDPPVRVGKREVACYLGGHLLLYDSRLKQTATEVMKGVVPLCDAGARRILCRRVSTGEIVLVELVSASIIRSFGILSGTGWTLDTVNGGILCSLPSDSWWRPEEYDLAALDLESGRITSGIRGFLMNGGVVRAEPRAQVRRSASR